MIKLRLFRLYFFVVIAIFDGSSLASVAPRIPITEDTCRIHIGDYRTQTQGGWGQDQCHGNNVACVRNAYFSNVFPNGVTIGGTYTILFTTSKAVAAYLPQGGPIGVLTQNYVDPTDLTSAGVFASQVLALKLSVAFGDYGVPTFGDLGPLIIANGPFEGWTVDQILSLANIVLGGDLGALPAGTSLDDLNETVESINSNFVDGKQNHHYLERECCLPPDAVCWPENPGRFSYGEALTVSAVVSNPDEDSYTVTGHYATSLCSSPATVTMTGPDLWSLTIPANCTQTYNDVFATFIVTDSCGFADSITCIVPACNAPSVECWTGNPVNYFYGQPLTLCAVASDADGDIISVTAEYFAGTCHTTAPATNMGNRWCVTIPANCTQSYVDIEVRFRATNDCGRTDSTECVVPVYCLQPDVECWDQNPSHFIYGHGFTACAVIEDFDQDISQVIAMYHVGNCNRTVEAYQSSDNRWCVDVPDSCALSCTPARIIFFAICGCNLSDADTCTIATQLCVPDVVCWNQNPDHYVRGQPLTVSALVVDADSNVTSVTAHYVIGSCNQTVPATYGGNYRWSVTIPANCTQTCSPADVTFAVTDACGASDSVTCHVTSENEEPVVTCWAGNPEQYMYGQPLNVCAEVADDENDVISVTAHYVIGNCNQTIPAVQIEGRWCVTVPASCTQSFDSIHVTFTAVDNCNLDGSATCVIPSNCEATTPPSLLGWEDNPSQYIPGNSVTVCVIVTDPDDDVVSVEAIYATAICVDTVAAQLAEPGRWCITVPNNCTSGGGDINVLFTASDSCGHSEFILIPIPPEPNPCGTNTDISCWPGNPETYSYGDSVRMCAVLDDLPGALLPVTAHYQTSLCDTTVTAELQGSRWCVWIPENCTQSFDDILVIFSVSDTCLFMHSDSCLIVPADCHPPVASCWAENPAEFEYGSPLTLCVNASDQDNDVLSITAHYTGELCNETVPATFEGGTLWCITIPATCTQSYEPIQTVFTVQDQCDLTGTATCVIQPSAPPPPGPGCCQMCISEPALLMTNNPVGDPLQDNLNLVIQMRDGRIHLDWEPVPGADYYRILRGDLGAPIERLESVGLTQSDQTDWVEPTPIGRLPQQQHYQIRAYQSGMSPALTEADRGQWEMNEGEGDTVYDASGYGRDAVRWPVCPPEWGLENDLECDSASTGFMDFDGYVFNPNRCAEHLRAANDTVFYEDRFQVWARIRIHDHPNSDTGPMYIVSNRVYGSAYSGGFGFRIEPGWYTDNNNVRHWHNRVLGIVWDRTIGDGIWRTIQSAQPTPPDTVTNSVPLNEWVCLVMIVDGDSSLLMIDDRVVATGDLTYRSNNNGAPLIIAAGHHHSTLPIEHPLRGELDCVRITDLD